MEAEINLSSARQSVWFASFITSPSVAPAIKYKYRKKEKEERERKRVNKHLEEVIE